MYSPVRPKPEELFKINIKVAYLIKLRRQKLQAGKIVRIAKQTYLEAWSLHTNTINEIDVSGYLKQRKDVKTFLRKNSPQMTIDGLVEKSPPEKWEPFSVEYRKQLLEARSLSKLLLNSTHFPRYDEEANVFYHVAFIVDIRRIPIDREVVKTHHAINWAFGKFPSEPKEYKKSKVYENFLQLQKTVIEKSLKYWRELDQLVTYRHFQRCLESMIQIKKRATRNKKRMDITKRLHTNRSWDFPSEVITDTLSQTKESELLEMAKPIKKQEIVDTVVGDEKLVRTVINSTRMSADRIKQINMRANLPETDYGTILKYSHNGTTCENFTSEEDNDDVFYTQDATQFTKRTQKSYRCLSKSSQKYMLSQTTNAGIEDVSMEIDSHRSSPFSQGKRRRVAEEDNTQQQFELRNMNMTPNVIQNHVFIPPVQNLPELVVPKQKKSGFVPTKKIDTIIAAYRYPLEEEIFKKPLSLVNAKLNVIVTPGNDDNKEEKQEPKEETKETTTNTASVKKERSQSVDCKQEGDKILNSDSEDGNSSENRRSNSQRSYISDYNFNIAAEYPEFTTEFSEPDSVIEMNKYSAPAMGNRLPNFESDKGYYHNKDKTLHSDPQDPSQSLFAE